MWSQILKAITVFFIAIGIIASIIIGINIMLDGEYGIGIGVILGGSFLTFISASGIMTAIEAAENIQNINDKLDRIITSSNYKNSVRSDILDNTPKSQSSAILDINKSTHSYVQTGKTIWSCGHCGYKNYSGDICDKCGTPK